MKRVLCWACLTLLLTTGLASAQAPTGVSDSYGYNLGTGTIVSAVDGVLQNDTDPNGDDLTAILQDDVQNGTLTLNPTGAFTYVPNNAFTGEDTFTYFANDGGANSGLVNVRFSPTPLLSVILTATGANVSVNDVAVFGPLGFGLDPGAFDGLVDPDPGSDANDPFDAPANPPILFGSPAILAIDNPTVTTTDLRYDARFFDAQPTPAPASATFTLKYNFGSPASPITLSWDAALFQSGGAFFDAGYTVAEVRQDGSVLASMDSGSVVLNGPNDGSVDFILARGNVAPVAFDDREIIIFRSEAGNGIAIDVLANDRDADGDPLTIQAVDSPTTQGGSTSHDGSTVTYIPPVQTTFEVTADTKTAAHPQFNIGSSNGYLIDGIEGRELFLKRGVTYAFNVNAPGHPFYFTDNDPVGGPSGTPYTDGVSGAPNASGTVTITPNVSTPDLLYYACQAHDNMGWKIHMVDTSGEATGLISDPEDENTFDTFTYTVRDDNSDTDIGEVSVVVLSGLIRASRTHAATAATTGPNRGVEVTVTVNYVNDADIDRIEITEVMPRTDEAFDTYSIPASADGNAIGGLAVFNDSNNIIQSVVVGADEVTFIWDGTGQLPQDSFSFTYRIVGTDCELDPDNDCDTKTKLFEAGTLDFTRNAQAQPTVPIATTNFTPEEFPIEISQNVLVTGEPNATTPRATFEVSLREQPATTVTITLSSSNTAEGDVSAPGSTLTFGPGDFSQAQTVTVTGGNDDINDGDQDYTISVVASGDAPYNGATGIVSLTNEDDDPAGFTVINSDANTDEAGDTAVITVVLDSEPIDPVTVTVALPNDLEVALNSADAHTFNSGNWSDPFSFIFAGQNDDVDDGDQQVSASFSVSSTDTQYSPLTIPDETLTNLDDDQAGVTVTDNADSSAHPSSDVNVTSILTSESGFARQLWVRLNSQPTNSTDVNITLGGTDPGEATLSTSTLSFGTGDWDTKQLIEVSGQDDNFDDGNASYTVEFTFNYSNVSDSVVVDGTNLDNEMAGLIITPQAGLITNENGGQVFLDVRLMGPPSDSVVVDVTGVDASEGLLSSNQLTFTTGNWFQTQTITVTGVGSDASVDGNVSYGLNFALTSNDGNFSGRFGRTIVITNLDSDTDADTSDVVFGPSWLNFGDVAVGETKTLHVTLQSTDAAEVTYATSSDSGAFTADAALAVAAGSTAAATITFTPDSVGTASGTISFAEGDGAGTIPITVIGRGVDSVDGVLLVAPTNVVAKPENAVADEVQVSFDIELTAENLVQLDFTLSYPSTLAVDSITSPLTDALFSDDGSGSIHFEYMDVGAGAIPTGSVLTVNATVDTTTVGAWPLNLTAVSTTPKTVALQISGGQLDVSDDISLADLDVNDDGEVKTNDLIIISRWDFFERFGVSLLPDGLVLPAGVTENDVIENTRALISSQDINMDGAWKTNDLIIQSRYDFHIRFGTDILPDGLILPDGVTEADVIKRIEALLP